MKGYVAVQRKILILIYTLWKNDSEYISNYKTSGNDEPKLLFSLGFEESVIKVPELTGTKESPEALFSLL